MTCLLFMGRLDKYHYANMINIPVLWSEISNQFTSDCCGELGLSHQSPLYTCVTAGSSALPKQLKVAALVEGKGIKFQPIEIEMSKEFQFHPIFACPVSREQTTSDNPPMLLSCGHVISKASMTKLSRGTARFKCPYCPTEQNTAKVTQVSF